jgi:hypothetical protein
MRPHIRKIVGFLEGVGAVDVAIANGGKHPRVIFWWSGIERRYFISGTPEDPDESARRAIADIRGMLGLVDHERRAGARRPHRRPHRPAPAAVPVLSASPAPDWKDGLALHQAVQATLRARLDAAWWAFWRECLARVDARAAGGGGNGERRFGAG